MKPLDILADSSIIPSDPLETEMQAMTDASASVFKAVAECANRFEYSTAHVGMTALRAQFASDPRLVAVETLLAIIQQQWPLVSSASLPEIHLDAVTQ